MPIIVCVEWENKTIVGRDHLPPHDVPGPDFNSWRSCLFAARLLMLRVRAHVCVLSLMHANFRLKDAKNAQKKCKNNNKQ